MINYQQAKSILKKAKIKIHNEKVLIKNSINRVVAKDIFSSSNHPLGNNAAFDGFAINASDTKNITKKKIINNQLGDVPKTYASITKARSDLNYIPKTNLFDGLQKMYNWMIINNRINI